MSERIEKMARLLQLLAKEMGVTCMALVFDEDDGRLVGVAVGEDQAVNDMAIGALDAGFEVDLATKSDGIEVH